MHYLRKSVKELLVQQEVKDSDLVFMVLTVSVGNIFTTLFVAMCSVSIIAVPNGRSDWSSVLELVASVEVCTVDVLVKTAWTLGICKGC